MEEDKRKGKLSRKDLLFIGLFLAAVAFFFISFYGSDGIGQFWLLYFLVFLGGVVLLLVIIKLVFQSMRRKKEGETLLVVPLSEKTDVDDTINT